LWQHANVLNPEVEVYAQQLRWLLQQFALNLEAMPAEHLTRAAPHLEANSALAIAKHGLAVTRAYVLGIGCGLDVTRDREVEFSADGIEGAGILAGLRRLPAELEAALARIEPATLDERVLPVQALYGSGEPREMSRREAIVENIRHLAIHLGELRLTRPLLLH
jgi:hypothetical protein